MSTLIRRRAAAREALRDLDVARRMWRVRSEDGKPSNVRDELIWRMDQMGDAKLDSAARLSVFRDVIQAFTPFEMAFKPDFEACHLLASKGAIRIAGELHKGGELVAVLDRQVFPKDRIAYNAYLRTFGAFKGTALAPLVIRQSFAFYDRIGIDRVYVHAALETGVYLWATCGFDFLKDNDRERVRLHFATLLKLLGRGYDVSSLDSAYQFANVGKADDAEVTFEELYTALAAAGLTSDDGPFRKAAADNDTGWDEPIALAKGIFLLYSEWWGVLVLDVGPQRAVFEAWAQARIRRQAQ